MCAARHTRVPLRQAGGWGGAKRVGRVVVSGEFAVGGGPRGAPFPVGPGERIGSKSCRVRLGVGLQLSVAPLADGQWGAPSMKAGARWPRCSWSRS
jgi:hypothetical protein